MFRPNIYETEVDMWSVGCLFIEMVLGEPLFRETQEIELLLSIFRVTGCPSPELIKSYIESGSSDMQPMVMFPAWKRIPLT